MDWALPDIHWRDALTQATAWVQRTILVPDTLFQAACAVVLLLAVLATARPLRAALLRQSDRLPPSPLRPVASALARAGPSILLLLPVWPSTPPALAPTCCGWRRASCSSGC